MTPKRPKELKWIGKELPDGRPIYFVHDVEPRDYTESETAELTQEQLQSARSSGLYREVHGADKPTKVVRKSEPTEADNAQHQAPGSDFENGQATAEEPNADTSATESDGE